MIRIEPKWVVRITEVPETPEQKWRRVRYQAWQAAKFHGCMLGFAIGVTLVIHAKDIAALLR